MSNELDVIFSTSYDDKYPPSNVLNSNNSMFWTSTGLYPQELVVSLRQPKPLRELEIISNNIKKLSIETCENDTAVKFITQFEKDNISKSEGSLQTTKCAFSDTSYLNKIIKIIIVEGYSKFCSINSIKIK